MTRLGIAAKVVFSRASKTVAQDKGHPVWVPLIVAMDGHYGR